MDTCIRSVRSAAALRLVCTIALVVTATGVGGPVSAVGAPSVASAPALGDLVVPVGALGAGWQETAREDLGPAEVRVRDLNPTDYAAPREATFWIRVVPAPGAVISPLDALTQLMAPALPDAAQPVYMGDSPDAFRVLVPDQDAGLAAVHYAYTIDRASVVVSVQGALEEQEDIATQADIFAGLQADWLRQTGLPDAAQPTPLPVPTAPVVAPPVVATPVPAAPAAPTPVPGPPASGTILFADNFNDATRPMLPVSSPDPSHWTRGYEGGEYVLRIADPNWEGAASTRLPGSFDDAVISVDLRFTQGADSAVGFVALRDTPDGGYLFAFTPFDQDFRFMRVEGDRTFVLVEWQKAAAIRSGSGVNNLRISLVGPRITVSMNGAQLVSVQDSTFKSGAVELATIRLKKTALEAHLDNLLVTVP